MKIDNEFTVSVPIQRAWEVLTDLEGIAPCLPGAQLTGVEGDVFSGKVKIKVGPVVSQYAGTARFVEKDDVSHRAVIDAKGKDSRGAGNASATIVANLRADGEKTIVNVDTDLNITGKIAQFGSGMIKEVSAKLLGQFVQNLETKLLAPEPAEAPAPAESVATESVGSPDSAGSTGSADSAPVPVPVSVPAQSAPAGTAAVPTSAPKPVPVSANGGVPAAATIAANGATPGRRVIVSDSEPEPLDLMSMAGSSVYKRAIPLGVGLVVVIGIIIYFGAK